MEGKLELISRYDEYYLVKSISNEDISLDDILLHNESGRIISVNRFWESNGSKTIMDTGVRNPIELVISGNTFKKLIGYYSKYQKLPLSKLSLKNCNAIANGYDLDELACTEIGIDISVIKHIDRKVIEKNESPTTPIHEAGALGAGLYHMVKGFEIGFQKALELLHDKKFGEDDIYNALDFARGNGKYRYGIMSDDDFIQSLQETQWDVQIEMIGPLVYTDDLPEDGEERPIYKPKLDAEGCIILKRK